MRPIALIAAAAVSLAATAAAAAPIGPVSRINVSIGSWLDQKQVDKVDQRDLEYLKTELRQSVEEQLAKTGQLVPTGGGTLELVLEDATANRPTQQELSYYPSLSWRSFSNGGAEITGTYTAPDGATTPIGYERREFDLRSARYAPTWRDANRAFDMFAIALSKGQADQRIYPRVEKKYYPGRDNLYSWR